MALQLTYNAATGVTHPLAYAKIVNFQGIIDRKVLHLNLDIFADQTARDEGKEPVGRVSVTIQGAEDWDAKVVNSKIPAEALTAYDVNMMNSYNLLKAEHPLFLGAIDV